MSSTVAVVLGTRPEIIKLAPVVRCLIDQQLDVAVVHTNQHYAEELDAVFFDELGMAAPRANLRVGSAGHGVQTGRMLERLEPVLAQIGPSCVLVQGDTNSVLAGALAAAKLRIPVGHVEAGLRSYDREMPEEINRVMTDHLADWLFAPTAGAVEALAREGILGARVTLTGNTVVDAVQQHAKLAAASPVLDRLGLVDTEYCLLTLHRPENTDDPARLAAIMTVLLDQVATPARPLVFPVHPRTTRALADAGWSSELQRSDRVRVTPALGYLEFLQLEQKSALTITDSGGVQEESCILGVPCVTIRRNTERPETVDVGANLVVHRPEAIPSAVATMLERPRSWTQPFGDGQAGRRIASIIAGFVAASA